MSTFCVFSFFFFPPHLVLASFSLCFVAYVCFLAKFSSFSLVRAGLHLFFVMIICAETFMSMLHNASHRQLYRSEFWSLNLVIPYGLCLFFGQTWNTYFYHHVKHHHVEDNGKFDLSSTSSFQRDSLPQFLLYFARFFFLIQMELPYYFFARGRYWSSAKVFLGEILSLMLFVGLTLRNPAAAITVFVIPFLLMRFFMMVKKIFSLVVDVCFFSFFCCLGCQLGSACVHR